MMKMLFALSFGFAGLIAATQAGFAAPQCAPRAAILAELATRYAEVRRGIGIAANATVVEVFAADGGSWTITATLPDGTTCLVASGEGWETLSEGLPATGDPA